MKILMRFIPTNFQPMRVWNRGNELCKTYSYKTRYISNLENIERYLPFTTKEIININVIGDKLSEVYVYGGNVDYKDILKGWLFDFEREYKQYLGKT